jgi:hypothetical protein
MGFKLRMIGIVYVAISLMISNIVFAQNLDKSFIISKRYVNFPIQMTQERQRMIFIAVQDTLTYSVIRLADDSTDYWVFSDLSQYQGQPITIHFSRRVLGIDKIYQSDFILPPSAVGIMIPMDWYIIRANITCIINIIPMR